MKQYTQEELNEILEKHQKYLKNEKGGVCADLSYADLRGANLIEANLIEADLSYANLSYADLSYADLRGADLIEANLIEADLSYADLRGADLREANLSYADLSYADLRGANLRDADLKYITGYTVLSTIFNSSRKNNQLNYVVELDIATSGCFQGTLQELKEKASETHKNNDVIRKRYEKAIKFIEEMVEDYKKQ